MNEDELTPEVSEYGASNTLSSDEGVFVSSEGSEVADPNHVPETSDQYALPDGMDAEMGQGFQQFAQSLGLNREQFDRLLEKGEGAGKRLNELIQVEIENQIAEATADLRQKWGRNFAANGQLAERALTRFAAPELVEDLKAGGWTREPAFIEFLHAVGERLGEDRIGKGASVSSSNPWSGDAPNLTEQGRIMRENPKLARSLAAQAGVSLG